MNEKQAKKLRQLVRHLMGRQAVTPAPWVVYNPRKTQDFSFRDKDGNVKTQTIQIGTQRLAASCGRAIYQQMKKNTALSGNTRHA